MPVVHTAPRSKSQSSRRLWYTQLLGQNHVTVTVSLLLYPVCPTPHLSVLAVTVFFSLPPSLVFCILSVPPLPSLFFLSPSLSLSLPLLCSVSLSHPSPLCSFCHRLFLSLSLSCVLSLCPTPPLSVLSVTVFFSLSLPPSLAFCLSVPPLPSLCHPPHLCFCLSHGLSLTPSLSHRPPTPPKHLLCNHPVCQHCTWR